MEPDGKASARAGRWGRAVRRWAPLALFLAALTASYVFLMSAGTWTHWPSWSSFYDAQAEGFRAGHLYLREAPSRALLALRDPLDATNMRFWRWDHSYYRGHLYVYWGLVPALALAAVKALFRIRQTISDDVLVFVFATGRLVVGTILIRAIAERSRPRPRPWAVWTAAAVFALAHPTPYTLARAGVYESAITGGAFFVLAGLGFGLRGISSSTPRSAARWLIPASLCFGLGGGTRLSLLPAVALLAAFTALVRWRIDGGGRHWVGASLAAGFPAMAVILSHLALNRLRFGAWTEFGASYQMGYPRLTLAGRFSLPDLYAYFLAPPWHGCRFPFLSARWYTTRLLAPAWLPWPGDHHANEPTVGLLTVVVFLWLLVALLLPRASPTSEECPDGATPPWRERWLWGALAIYTLASLIPIGLLSSSTMRYQGDFASGLLLLAILAGWRLLAGPRSVAGRRAAAFVYGALALATIGTGFLLGFSGYFDLFARYNPALLHTLGQTFNLCGR